MKKSTQLILSVVLCLLLAAGGYFWATGMISSNYDYRSPLDQHTPAKGQALGSAATQRLVIVLIDGLRYDTSLRADTMPNLASLRQQGAFAKMHSQPPSFSAPGYSTIFSGAWPYMNDGPVFNLDYDEYVTWPQDNLFSAVHDAGFKTAISAYNWFEKLVPQADVDISFYTAGDDKAADEDVMKAALPWLQNNEAQFVLIHIDQVDYAGHHEGGPHSIAGFQAAKRADDDLGQILATLDLSKDTVMVISDHGHIDAGGHGGQDAVVLQEPFVIAGAGVKPGDAGDINMVDLAPTLATLFGTRLPAASQGSARIDIVNPSADTLAALPAAIESQQTALVNAYANGIGKTVSEGDLPKGADVSQYQAVIETMRASGHTGGRIARGLVALMALAAFVYIMKKTFRKGALAWIFGGLAFAILFNFRYGMWDKRAYSLSSIISESELMVYVGVTALLALLIVWLAVMLDQRYFRLTAVDAAQKMFGLVFTVAFINFLPALLSFVVNGPIVTWDLPNYITSFLALLSLIQVIVIAVGGLIFTGITALIANAVQRKAAK